MSVLFVPDSGSKSPFSFPVIHRNYLKCRKNKRNSFKALEFEINAEENICQLERELQSKSYHPSPSILFTAHKPKVREIFAASFRDRIVHHILVEHLEKIWEPMFIFDNYACRRNKGTHAAVLRLQAFLRKLTCNGNERAYYLQLDIKDFFISINKRILWDLVSQRVSDPEILWIAHQTIFWDCTKGYVQRGDPRLHAAIPANKTLFGKQNLRGLAIGNLPSQWFANIYLNELDQFVKHTLKAHYYLRYVDDFIVLSVDPVELMEFQEKIEDFLMSRLSLQLHPTRRKLLPVSAGIDFLGYIVRSQYVLVRRRVINNLRAKIDDFERSKYKDIEALHNTLASYCGHLELANSYRLKNRILSRIEAAKNI